MFGVAFGVGSAAINIIAPMPKISAGVPQVKNSNGRLQLTFTYCGERLYLSLGLPDSKQNRNFAELTSKRIVNDILGGHFDGDLNKYKPQRPIKKPDPLSSGEVTIRDLWDKYTAYKRPQLSQTTLAIDYARVDKWIDRLPTTSFDSAIEVRDWLLETTTPRQSKRLLKQLSACGRWAVKSRLLTTNPFDGLAADISSQEEDEKMDVVPFSADERDRIIQRFKDNSSNYAAMVEFLLRTGARPSEAIGLCWGHISTDFKTITFKQAVTTGESGRLVVKQGLKTQKERAFPCGAKLTEFLQLIAPNGKDPEQFLFTSPEGKLVDMENFSRREWKPTLTALGIEPRGIYQTRHSFITFCLEQGMEAKDVARLVGNSPEIIYRHYAGAKKDLIAPDID
jgi:integrase